MGAFELTPNAGDFAHLYYLPGGAYTPQLFASDGGAREALLELYAFPLERVSVP